MHVRLTPALLVLLGGVTLGGCGVFGPDVDCGPLDARACEQRVEEIQATVSREFPGRRVVSIEIVNEDAHANVRLDDGREIGFGERL